MINIKNKDNCCGCSACVEICPRHCISFNNDKEGFKYPIVNIEECIDCHLCEKVCPVIHQGDEKLPIKNYAAINKNLEIRKRSSSGGFFYLLASKIIKQGGIVWGAKFNKDWEVVMDFTDRIDGLLPFEPADLKPHAAAEGQDPVPLGVRSDELELLVLLRPLLRLDLARLGGEKHQRAVLGHLASGAEKRVSVIGPGPVHVEFACFSQVFGTGVLFQGLSD